MNVLISTLKRCRIPSKTQEYVCDQCNEDALYGDSQPNTQDPISEQGDNDVTTERNTSPDSQATGVNTE